MWLKKSARPSDPKKLEIFKELRRISRGSVDVVYRPAYKRFANSKPEELICVIGRDIYCGGKRFSMRRKGMPKRTFDDSVMLTFYLEKNLDDIRAWLFEGVDDKTDNMDDFMENFDAYQGLAPIFPTKEKPYEFIDLD